MSLPAAGLLGWLPRRRAKVADKPTANAQISAWNGRFAASWQLSHKLGNVFTLTNIADRMASDVEVTTDMPDVDVRLRNGPWQTIAPGGTREFVAICDPTIAGLILITWTALDGTSNKAEVIIEPAPGDHGTRS